MQQLFNTLLILHVAGGTIGLISGTIAAAVVKGKKAHTTNGKIFFFAMLTAAVSSLIISNMPGHINVFLFAVGGFTFYMICSGYRAVWLKRNFGKTMKSFSLIDYSLTLFAAGFGIFLITLSVKSVIQTDMFGIVPGVFGVICLSYAALDYRYLSGKVTVKLSWMSNHITRMMGAMIASYTAFLVVNVQISMQWILWILPTAAGGMLIRFFLKKYVPGKHSQMISNPR